MLNIIVINGPNLNLLGQREKDIYGDLTLKEIQNKIIDYFKDTDVNIDFFQSNEEGKIINKIQQSTEYEGMVINPGGYTHYSIAILDAIRSIKIPVIEVHISNIFSRESYRKNSVTAEGCMGIISGFNYYGYIMAINAIVNKILNK